MSLIIIECQGKVSLDSGFDMPGRGSGLENERAGTERDRQSQAGGKDVGILT